MRVLLVKVSSLGDVLHTLPAVTDAACAIPGIAFDWVVEEAFAEIPAWHPAVKNVIPVAQRRWRMAPGRLASWREMRAFRRRLREQRYDLVLDAQGLLKSALISRLARGARAGLAKDSAREPLSAAFYTRHYAVERNMHAIKRVRTLFSQALSYSPDLQMIDYGVDISRFERPDGQHQPYVFLLHGTVWPTKRWPETNWKALIAGLEARGLQPVLTWGNGEEKARAQRLAASGGNVKILDRQSLTSIAAWLAQADAIVGVDTGLLHLAAALAVPAAAIYGATDPALTGAMGDRVELMQSRYSCAPCLSRQCRFGDVAEHDNSDRVFPPCYEEISAGRVLAWLDERLAVSITRKAALST